MRIEMGRIRREWTIKSDDGREKNQTRARINQNDGRENLSRMENTSGSEAVENTTNENNG
jgi:hypothetical protein